MSTSVVVPMPGDGYASCVRAAVASAFRQCVMTERDVDAHADDNGTIAHHDESHLHACTADCDANSEPLFSCVAASNNVSARAERMSRTPAAARWVCFPFSERAYGSNDRDTQAPALAAAFVDERRWQRVARRRLARGSAFGWRAARTAGAAVVPYLPLEPENAIDGDRPFALAPGLRLVGCLCASRSASVFCARIDVAPYPVHPQSSSSSSSSSSSCLQKTSCSTAATSTKMAQTNGVAAGATKSTKDRGKPHGARAAHALSKTVEIECVVKVINVRLSGDFERGWTGTRRSVGRGDHLVCAPAWSEPVALSRTYPTHFYGSGLFFCAADGDWYVCVAMPRYRSTLWTISTGLSHVNASDASGAVWADMLLAALVQVVLYTLPRVRRNRLAAHNDLKIDNIAYRRTSRQHVYVHVETAGRSHLVAIPTYGRLFYLIDFGWSSVSVGGHARRPVRVESASCTVAGGTMMRAWNTGTDPAQMAYSMMSAVRNRLGCVAGTSFYKHTGRAWWPLADALGALMAIGDGPQSGPPAVLPLDQSQRRVDDANADKHHICTTTTTTTIEKGDHASENNDADDDSSDDNNARDGESSSSLWDDLFYAGISRACRLGRMDAFVAMAIDRFGVTSSDAPPPRRDRIVAPFAL